jgi:Uma2 family endonuclease
MNIYSMFIPMMAMFLLTGVLSGIWPSTSPVHAQITNQTAAATIDQLASNLTQANSELPIKPQLKVEILVPIFYNNGTNVEAEKYRILFEELVKQFGAVSLEDNNVINGYWINPQDNKAYADKNKVYWIIVPDTEENRQYFVNLQNKLESLFKQESILIYFTPVLSLLSD